MVYRGLMLWRAAGCATIRDDADDTGSIGGANGPDRIGRKISNLSAANRAV